jgi:hypothetical protein
MCLYILNVEKNNNNNNNCSLIRPFFFLSLSFRIMDSNKRGFSLFGNYNLNEPIPNVPGKYLAIN